MKTWEIDVEIKVRRTLILGGPATEPAARDVVERALRGELDLTILTKHRADNASLRAVPVEVLIDPTPGIVAVRDLTSPKRGQFRFQVKQGSELGHGCCFDATVIDVTQPTDINGEILRDFTVVCECSDLDRAETIAAALNAADNG